MQLVAITKQPKTELICTQPCHTTLQQYKYRSLGYTRTPVRYKLLCTYSDKVRLG